MSTVAVFFCMEEKIPRTCFKPSTLR